jgi:hypothetical protein
MRRKQVLNTGNIGRNELDIRQRRYSRLLVPGGILAELPEPPGPARSGCVSVGRTLKCTSSGVYEAGTPSRQ